MSLAKIPDTLCTRNKVSPDTKYKQSCHGNIYGKRLECHYVAVLDGHV